MQVIFKILLLFLLSVTILLFGDYRSLGEFYFYFLVGITSYAVIKNRKITLLNVWNCAFLFIILSEVFSTKFVISASKLPALKFLTIANNFIIIGYLSKINKPKFTLSPRKIDEAKTNKFAPIILMSLVIFYFFDKIQSALIQLAIGRVGVDNLQMESVILTNIINSIGFILPSILSYYFIIVKRKKIIFPFILSSPIFLILFIGGYSLSIIIFPYRICYSCSVKNS